MKTTRPVIGRQPERQPEPEDVASAEARQSRFEAERDEILARQKTLADRRRECSFDAHNGDVAAGRLVDGLAREAAELQVRFDSIDDAIREGERRLHQARQRAERARELANAKAQRDALEHFKRAGHLLDRACAVLFEASGQYTAAIDELHTLGIAHPSIEQIDVLGHRAVLTALNGTPWARRFDRLAPHERTTFAALTAGWADMVERNIAARVGATKETEAA